MKWNNLLKKFISFWIICFIVLCMTGCEYGRQKKEVEKSKGDGVAKFVPYMQSIATGNNEFDLLFYCDDEVKSAWVKDNIEEISIQIGKSNTTSMSVEDIELTDDGEYCKGILKVTGEFEQECSGDMSLLVLMKNNQEKQKYELGECAVVDNNKTNYSDINQLQCGGVVKTDEKENVCTYGIIVHVEIGSDISIKKIDLALDQVGVDTDNYVIYSSQEYKERIEKSLDETTFDKINKDAYKKKRVSSIKKTIDLHLKRGEYYIYFPLVFMSSEAPGLVQSVIKLKYTNNRGEDISFISNCFPYFSEFSKSEMIVKDMFNDNGE